MLSPLRGSLNAWPLAQGSQVGSPGVFGASNVPAWLGPYPLGQVAGLGPVPHPGQIEVGGWKVHQGGEAEAMHPGVLDY